MSSLERELTGEKLFPKEGRVWAGLRSVKQRGTSETCPESARPGEGPLGAVAAVGGHTAPVSEVQCGRLQETLSVMK